MTKKSKSIVQRKAELKAREAKLVEELSQSSQEIEKIVSSNLKKIGVIALGSVASYVLVKMLTGGFSSNSSAIEGTKKSRLSKNATPLLLSALKKLLPIIIERLKSESTASKS